MSDQAAKPVTFKTVSDALMDALSESDDAEKVIVLMVKKDDDNVYWWKNDIREFEMVGIMHCGFDLIKETYEPPEDEDDT